MLLRHLEIAKYIKNGQTLLDIGCGFNGHLLNRFSTHISHGIGIDLPVNQKKNSEKIQLIEWNLNNPSFPDLPKVDLATCLEVAEHVEDPLNLLKNIYQTLNDHGLLILTVPTWQEKPLAEFAAFKLKLLSAQEIADHKHYFSREEIIDCCHQAGFKNVKYSAHNFKMKNFVLARKN
ncbi:MAG: hypothetical protein A2445_02980 [Candidatus Jacksonbacteria bacterium RIFOXYC2_FULL_44_29]|nr:MAG: Methyltransferase type 11 [Parcubacteria group bacterium GW2011_GWA2_42_28]KKT53791.1 MAG: Methyltransferase type 11 [Parcubacteria group bacterium GW2011_GWC2_44_22]OGY76688.1 MAG: hypothetical protein A2240_02200 [Candidatus Jacksonbacteria bacterium RIFOXYA2_FULL_43_12]OGY77598.1 MAG: hypothetical protein A2295_05700 [Candidatus Jacksonbacteria bacterium RIFOXYB2_FULL_44_15]OGY79720.1 MAG: hypothetical protein A2550_05675 [Candidatus Jacksonbacteria bacterium RIFOXYD2_FULL_43_21]OGY